MKHERLTHGAIVGRSRSRGSKLHVIRPGSLTSYCSVPVTWKAGGEYAHDVCLNCINEMMRKT